MNQMHRLGTDLSALSDAELITSSRAGSDAAFAELYRRHAGSARAAARSLGASRSDVDDLVAEAFTRVLSALQRGAGPEVAFRPYLMTCVRNAWYDKARKDGRVDVPGDVPEDINLALLNVPPDSEDARMVAAAFASLPERWQMVLWHTEVEGRPAAEVGPLLGLAPNAVAALAYRAREGLRQAYLQAHLQLPPPDACRETITKLGAYVRDGLSARDRRKVDEHLKNCERCTAVLLELQEVSTSLRGVLVPVLLGVAGTAFLAHLGAGGSTFLALLRWRPRTPATQAGVVAATAAAVVAGVVGVAAVNQHGGERIATEGAAPVTTTAAPRPSSAPSTAPPSVVTTPIAAPETVPTLPPASVIPTTPATAPASTAARRTTPATTAPRRSTATTTSTSTSTTTTTTTTVAVEPPVTTTPAPLPPPPVLVPLSVSATPIGPAFAGLSATVNVATGVTPPVAGAALGRSLAVQADAAEPAGPVTVTASVPVLDWGVPGCSPGTTCLLTAPALDLTLRLDLATVKAGDAVPVTITTTADGAAPATATLALTASAAPAGLSYFTVDRGGLAMAANTVLTCLPQDGHCTQNNNTSDLGYVDEGSIPGAIDSSLADLALPAGATVLHATLQWGGNPAGASDNSPAALGAVTFVVPGGTPTVVHASAAPLETPDEAYAASADVTELLRQLPSASGTYQVADVQTGTGPGQFGGWTLLVAYRLPDAPLQALAVFDDPGPGGHFSKVKDGVRFALPGFAAPPSVQVGVVGYEGDLGLQSDRATVGGKTLGLPNNFFHSSIDVGDAARVPPEANQYGFDAQLLDVQGGLTADPDGLAVTFTTTAAEAVYVGGVAIAFPV
jgi:RNA polymerase sigma factor (sigma-70 family)